MKSYFSRMLDRLAPREGLVLMVMAIVVGAGTGFAAVLFIKLISYIHYFSYDVAASYFSFLGRFWFVLVPAIGALIGGPIIAYFATEAKGHGVPEVMQALMLHGGRIRPRVAFAKILASALCIGSGGSAGREGPIVQVGSTLGSFIGQLLRLSDERIKNLVACGAAAGIAATFNAPIAGVAFSIEVLLSDLQVAVFGNVVIAAVSASIVSQIMLGARPAFEVPSYVLHSPWEILLYVFLGLLAALVGVFFIRLLDGCENYFDGLHLPQAVKPALGALMLGGLAFFYPYVTSHMSIFPENSRLGFPLIDNVPHIFGSGFDFIDQVLQGDASFGLLLILVFLKPLATSFTLGSGNSGGVFAPALFTGAMLGGAYGHVVKYLVPGIPIDIGAYALVGMASVFAAAAHAPLTAMLIVFEMSNDYQLILPLMAAAITASVIAQWRLPDSIYSIKLKKRGIHFEQGRDMDVMQGVLVEEVMNHAPITINKEQSAAELFALFNETHLQGFPVMVNDEDLYGVVSLQDMERTIQAMEDGTHKGSVALGKMKVGDVAVTPPLTVYPDEPIGTAIRKMAPRDLARLPVVSRDAPEKLVGLISRSDIVRAYQVGIMRKQQQHVLQKRRGVVHGSGDEVTIVDLTVASDSISVGKRLADISLHQSTSVVAIKRRNAVVMASSDTVFAVGDILTVFCRIVHVDELRRTFEGTVK